MVKMGRKNNGEKLQSFKSSFFSQEKKTAKTFQLKRIELHYSQTEKIKHIF